MSARDTDCNGDETQPRPNRVRLCLADHLARIVCRETPAKKTIFAPSDLLQQVIDLIW
jgi:hypothetical protein